EIPVHKALLADAYPIAGRSRIYGLHQAAQPVGQTFGPALAGGAAAIAGGVAGWRWAFGAFAVPAVILAVLALRLREPGRGRNEQLAVLGEELEPAAAGHVSAPLSAAFARLKRIKTFSYLLMAL